MSAVVKPADARRLYQQVADQIRAVIEEGRYGPGARLPPERELALQLGVSRPSLREALIALEIEGRVEIRMGSGVYVCARPLGEDAAMGLLGDSPTELMQARSTLEGAVAALAAARMSKPVLERLRSCVEGMRQDIAKGTPPVEADRRFHVLLAEATGNTILARMVGELFDGRHSPISTRLTHRAENARTWECALVEHEAICRALEARDPQAAQAAMVNHLKNSEERWIGQGDSAQEA